MTKYITPILFLFALLGKAFGQEQLPNGSFENWSARATNIHEEPTGWFSLGELKKFSYPATTSQTTDAHSGNYAVLLETKPGPSSDIPGLLLSNNMLDSNSQPDFNRNQIAFQSRPVSANFWYKATLQSGDSCIFQMTLTQWNAQTSKRDTVGQAQWFAPQTSSSYAKAIVTFAYYSTAQPDSASIIFSTTVIPFGPMVGAKLFLDDFSLTYPGVSVESIDKPNQTIFYPQPASSEIVLGDISSCSDLLIFDANGVEVIHAQNIHPGLIIPLNNLSNGYYLLLLTDENSLVKHKQKMIVIR